MYTGNNSRSGRDPETSDSAPGVFDRRSILRTLGIGLVGFGGASGSALAQTDQDGGSDDRRFEVSYGTNSEFVAPFNGTDPITDVYDYSGYTADIELQQEDTARLFLYSGPDGLSLGTIIDSVDSDTGGSFSYEINELDTIDWGIKDDNGDEFGDSPRWSWDNYNTDGGVLKLPDDFEITITPRPEEGRNDSFNDEDQTLNDDGDWQFVYGEFEDGSFRNIETIDLTANGELQRVTITPGGQQTETEAPAPSIDPASVRLSRTAVEAQADEQGPTLEVTVSNAEDVRAELNAETVRPEVYDEGDFEFTMNPVDSPEVPMLPEQYRSTEDSDRERYNTTFVIPDVEPGDWVPITIVAEGPGGTAELTEYGSSTAQSGEGADSSYHAPNLEYNKDNQFTDIGKRIGFGVFDNVIEGPMVIARDEDDNTTDEEQRRRAEDIRFYERAREHDINRALVSNVMTMGAVGIDIRFDDNGARVHQLPKSEYNSVENLIDDGINKSGIDYDDGSNAFYAVATEQEPSELDLTSADGTNFAGIQISSSGIAKVYIGEFVPSNSNSDDYRNKALSTHLEELLHAYGYPDLYRGKHINSNLTIGTGDLDLFGNGNSDILSTGTRIADSLVIKRRPDIRVGEDTESPTVEDSFTDFLQPEAARIGNDTSWERQRFDIKKITNYSLGDEAVLLTNEAGETDSALIPEWRENIPNDRFDSTVDQGIVFYRYKQRFARVAKYVAVVEPDSSVPVPRIITPEDEPTTIVPGIGIGYELKVTFDPTQSEDGNLLVEKGVSNGIVGKLVSGASGLLEEVSSTTESLQTDTQQPLPPTPSLRAVDADGRVTGYTDDGEYVRDIPGSQASGDQYGGLEWIKIPAESDVEFEVVYPSIDAEEATEDVNAENLQRVCEVEELRYDADAELTVTDEGTTVEGVQKEMHRGTVEPDQTVQTTELSLPEEDSQSTEQPTEQEQTQEQVTEAADTESNEEINVDIDVEDVSTLPPAQVGGALAAGVTAAYLLKRRL